MLVLAAPAASWARGSVEVVVTLRGPSLADAATHDRALASVTMTRSRLELASPSSVSYLQSLDRQQSTVAARIARAIPGAHVRWRYAITINALAVVLPKNDLGALSRVSGISEVWPTARYHASLDRSPQLIGAPALWGPTLATAGQGMKIGDHRRGRRPDASVLLPGGLHDARGYPKGDPLSRPPR